jgi:FAD binding domain-containing protein/berberine-like enzyme
MKQSSSPATPDSEPDSEPGSEPDAGPQNATRRKVLLAAGLVGAAAVADTYLDHGGAAARTLLRARDTSLVSSARPAWLAGPGSTPSDKEWQALQHKLSTDKLIRPGQRAYNGAKQLFDPMYDSLNPAGIAYCAKPADVAACISFVKSFKIPVRVRSGGHSYAGWSSLNNGLIIDVTAMNGLRVGNGSVTVGSGVRLIDFYAGLAAHGKAVPGGSCATVGIAGLALGGGIGVLSRIYGLTSDCIQSVDVVTADGSTLTCTPNNNHSDLYWASRGGGGGNFGVTTSFTFKTFDLSSLYIFSMSWNWRYANRVVGAWQSWAPHTPDALWANMHLSAATGGPPHVGAGGTYVGSRAALVQEIDKFLHMVGEPTAGPVGIYPNTYLQAMLAEAGCSNLPACHLPPAGNIPRSPWYAKSDFFSRPLDSTGISVLLRGIEDLGRVSGAYKGSGSISFDALGGKVNQVAASDTAFVHRNALWVSQYYTDWVWPGSAAGRANQYKWITSYYNSLHPHADGEAYQNYIDPALKDWQKAYYGNNYNRLQEVKTKYDKGKLFDFPQAIQPLSMTSCDGPAC